MDRDYEIEDEPSPKLWDEYLFAEMNYNIDDLIRLEQDSRIQKRLRREREEVNFYMLIQAIKAPINLDEIMKIVN